MENNEDFILWLPSWYPNKLDSYNGDFIQRHARAASLLQNIIVLYITDADIDTPIKHDITNNKNLTEEIIYFKRSKTFLFKIIKQFVWFNLYKKTIRKYIAKFGKPDCLHVHVAWKAGMVAMWVKRKYNIPYVITEHWGIYNDIVKDNYSSKPGYFKKIIKKIFLKADYFLSVSKFIAEGVSTLIERKPYSVIPNVVDTTLFYSSSSQKPIFTFLHVSNMVELKNIPGILTAFKLLIEQAPSQNIQLVFVGNRYNQYHELVSDLQIDEKYVFFKGETSYEAVAEEMKAADCFILNSIIENSPCVIGEALCCGLPVIATNVGGVPELITEKDGILIPPYDDVALMNAMRTMISDSKTYNREGIALQAKEKFNYLSFSQQLSKIYDSIKSRKDIL